MKEITVENSSSWQEGKLYGSSIIDNAIINDRIKLNDSRFNDPIYNLWQTTIIQDIGSIEQNEDYLNLEVEKVNEEETTADDIICSAETKFYEEEELTTEKEVSQLTVNFDWTAYKTPNQEECGLKIVGESNELEVVFTNRSSIYLRQGGNQIEIDTSSDDSAGNINNLITNQLNDFYLDFVVFNDTIYTRLRSNGYQSIWYENDFISKIQNLQVLHYNNSEASAIINTNLVINSLYAEGFEQQVSYQSQVFDAHENDAILEDITLKGIFPQQQVTDNSLILESDTNQAKINIYAANQLEDLNIKIDDSNPDQVISITPESEELIYSAQISNADSNVEGRYFVVQIEISNSQYYQNRIDYFTLRYELQSNLNDDYVAELEEKEITKTIGVDGGVIELNDNYFSAKLYIPVNALTESKDITVRRLASTDERLTNNFIGFEFEPSIDFNEPAMLEFDYASYNFDTYQSEAGLTISYLDEANDEVTALNTILFEEKDKAVAYINHFSIYGLQIKDDLYKERTKIIADDLPSWMELQKKESNFQQLVNYGAAEKLDQAQEDILSDRSNRFIDQANTDMPAWAFKTHIKNFKDNNDNYLDLNRIDEITEGTETKLAVEILGVEIPATTDDVEFYQSYIADNDELFYLDLKQRILYFQKPYEKLELMDKFNVETYQLESNLKAHHIWNIFDEFGMLFDLPRLPEESNEDYKSRILDVFANPGDSTEEGLLNHISRSLGLDQSEVDLHALNESDYIDYLTRPDGSASQEFIELVDYIKNFTNLFWDEFVWDEGYWDTVDKEGIGYGFLPTRTDFSKLDIDRIDKAI